MKNDMRGEVTYLLLLYSVLLHVLSCFLFGEQVWFFCKKVQANYHLIVAINVIVLVMTAIVRLVCCCLPFSTARSLLMMLTTDAGEQRE